MIEILILFAVSILGIGIFLVLYIFERLSIGTLQVLINSLLGRFK